MRIAATITVAACLASAVWNKDMTALKKMAGSAVEVDHDVDFDHDVDYDLDNTTVEFVQEDAEHFPTVFLSDNSVSAKNRPKKQYGFKGYGECRLQSGNYGLKFQVHLKSSQVRVPWAKAKDVVLMGSPETRTKARGYKKVLKSCMSICDKMEICKGVEVVTSGCETPDVPSSETCTFLYHGACYCWKQPSCNLLTDYPTWQSSKDFTALVSEWGYQVTLKTTRRKTHYTATSYCGGGQCTQDIKDASFGPTTVRLNPREGWTCFVEGAQSISLLEGTTQKSKIAEKQSDDDTPTSDSADTVLCPDGTELPLGKTMADCN